MNVLDYNKYNAEGLVLMEKQREYLFDNLKGMLIILVVFGHFIERYVTKDEKLRYIYHFIYMFHMPLFIFISGYFSKKVAKCRKQAVNNLLIPYIILNSIYYMYVFVFEGNHKINIFNPGFTLWYLLSLFFWRFFLKDVVKIKNKLIVMLLSVLGGVFIGSIQKNEYFLSLARTVAFFPYFLLGYYFSKDNIRYIKERTKILCMILICILGVLVPLLISKFNINYGVLGLALGYKKCGFDTITYGIIFRLTMYVLSSIFSLSVINIVSKNKTILSNIGRNSLYIYAGHIYIFLLFKKYVPVYNTKINFSLCCLFSVLTISILSTKNIKNMYDKSLDKVLKILNLRNNHINIS